MKFSLENANTRNIGNNMKIYDLFSDKNANFDFVISELKGDHPMIINHVSDRMYFILDGKGEVFVENKWVSVKAEDGVYIKRGDRHSIRGTLKYVIITAPPFSAENETQV